MSVGSDAAPAVTAPLVLQCDKCATIVGDSLAWVQADEATGTITLSAMREVLCHEEGLETSKSGKDVGCTFVPIGCARCGAILGKMYKTTSRAFDPIRDYYTVSVHTLRSYTLGSYDATAHAVEGAAPAVAAPMEIAPSAELKKVQEGLLKVQQMLLLFDERISALEQAAAEDGSSKKARKSSSSDGKRG